MADQDFNIKVVTTADTTGIRQTADGLTQIQRMQAAAAQQAAQQGGGTQASAAAQAAAYQLGQSLRVIAGGALITAGYQFVTQLRAAATEIEKISASLDKEGAQIVANAQKMAELSRFAEDNSDVIKLGEGALKSVEAAHSRLIEEAGKELTIWQKIADVWAAGFRDKGPIAQAQDLAKAQAELNYEMARTSAIQSISAAKTNAARLASESYEQTVARLNARMKEQEALAATHWLQQDVSSYLSASRYAENYRKELEQLKAEHDKLTSKTEKYIETADPQVQAILKNEKAMFDARAQGRDRDASLYEKSAQNFRASATPKQLEEVSKIYSGKDVVDAIKQLGIDQRERDRQLIELWR